MITEEGGRDLIHLVSASAYRSPQIAAVPAQSSLCLKHKSENKIKELLPTIESYI